MNLPRLKSVMAMGAVVCFLVGSAGSRAQAADKPTPEEVLKSLLTDYNQASAAIRSIEDNETADAAIPKIKELAAKVAKGKKQWTDLKLSEKQRGKLFEKHEIAYTDACNDMQASIGGLNNAFAAISGDRQKKIIEAIGKTKELELFGK